MIALIAIAAILPVAPAAAVPVAAPQRRQASASARVVRAASASQKDWDSAAAGHRREVLLREKDGRTTLVRMIEHE